MKVFVVMRNFEDFTEFALDAIFSTREKADAYASNMIDESRIDEWPVDPEAACKKSIVDDLCDQVLRGRLSVREAFEKLLEHQAQHSRS